MKDCCSGGSKVLIYACSGSSDVGEIADKVARKLSKEGVGKMTCLAGLGAGLSGFIESAKSADVNITIDGCKVHCAKKSLEKVSTKTKFFVLTDFGLEKNKTPVCDDIIEIVSKKIKNVVGNNAADKNSSSCCCE